MVTGAESRSIRTASSDGGQKARLKKCLVSILYILSTRGVTAQLCTCRDRKASFDPFSLSEEDKMAKTVVAMASCLLRCLTSMARK
ncbi:hypothetical protein HDV57DRAFT_503913 [Trichoderma longibrachiatum]